MKTKNDIFKITFTAIMLALAVVLSSFCQIRLFSDIRLDLSYVVIVTMCYLYGGLVGGFFAGGVALMNSMFFSAYGVSISWITANLIIGFIVGTVLHNIKPQKSWVKYVLDIATVIIACALGLLAAKTLIECKLYNIPFAVKIIKNLVAFGSDTLLMIIGYFTIIPLYNFFYNKKMKEE